MTIMRKIEIESPKTIDYSVELAERLRLEKKFAPLLHENLSFQDIVSFIGNKRIPLLRLYRFKEAFSFEFVREMIRRLELKSTDYILDPFVGMGTTTFASMLSGIPSIGIEKLPIAAFVAQTLPLFFTIQEGELTATWDKLRHMSYKGEIAEVALDVPIMKLAIDEETLLNLRRWKRAIDGLPFPLKDVFLLLFFSILERCSYASNDGQFLRLKRDRPLAKPEEALYKKVIEAEDDINRIKWEFPNWERLASPYMPDIHLWDARNLSSMSFKCQPTAIITSPPYPNRYDYSRSYCLELCFHFVKNFSELKAIRFGLLRSHIESKLSIDEAVPHPAISDVLRALDGKKLNNPRIPDLLKAYFIDMKKVIEEWGKVLAPQAKVAMVVDNVRFEGQLVPTDLILSEMAEDAGFEVQEIIIARYKGNSSQQMKKYGRVPVRESIVIWQKRGISCHESLQPPTPYCGGKPKKPNMRLEPLFSTTGD